MSNDTVRKALWWVCLLVASLVLIAIELFHPAGFTQNPGMYQYLSKPEPYDPRFQALAYWGRPGPIAFALLIAAALWMKLAGRRPDRTIAGGGRVSPAMNG